MSAPVVIYAALSKKGDDLESIPSQIAKVRERLARLYPDGYDLKGIYEDDGFSGSKRDRGPGLEQAIATVIHAAQAHGHAELWANTSARFARGKGGPNAARALGKLYYDLKAVGVALRTVADDEYLTNEMLVGFASAQASKYSADLSESVTRAKRRQAERGEHLGGPLPIGYAKGPVIDPVMRPTVDRIFELAAQGVPDAKLARTVNAEGHRTRSGRPFDRRAIQAIVTNPFYAGRIVYDGETFKGKHPALIAPEVFDAIQAARPRRDLGAGHHEAGAPARRHLLSRLAICGQCGERMYALTSPYRRKDGSKARSYQCHAYKFATGLCGAKPINAEVVDAAVMAHLDDLLPDFERWVASIEDRQQGERDRLAKMVQKAEADRDRMAANAVKHERRYRDAVAADDDAKADLALEFVQATSRPLRHGSGPSVTRSTRSRRRHRMTRCWTSRSTSARRCAARSMASAPWSRPTGRSSRCSTRSSSTRSSGRSARCWYSRSSMWRSRTPSRTAGRCSWRPMSRPRRWPGRDPMTIPPTPRSLGTKDRGYGFHVRGVATGATAPARSDTPPGLRADFRSSRSAAGAG